VTASDPSTEVPAVTVDPALSGLLDAFDDGSPFDVHRARAVLDAFAAELAAGTRPGDAEDRELAGVRVRRYRPSTTPRGPALVWFHGGGFVTGSLDAVDPICRSVLTRTGAPITSVDYRLAPEHPFPAALEDGVAVLRAVAEQGPVAVGGDSAGGGLAAAACLAVRDEGLPVVGQLLVNPLLDCTLSQPSVDEHATGFGLTRDALERFVGLYLDGADPIDPRCSPLLADDVAGLPPTVVVTAEFDPLRDEGEEYAARLEAAGVPVAVRRFSGMVHGFVGMTALTPVAGEALDWMVDELVRLSVPA
jgi:acetyl esterase